MFNNSKNDERYQATEAKEKGIFREKGMLTDKFIVDNGFLAKTGFAMRMLTYNGI